MTWPCQIVNSEATILDVAKFQLAMLTVGTKKAWLKTFYASTNHLKKKLLWFKIFAHDASFL